MFKLQLGAVDRVGDHFVGTVFFSFIGPLIPLRSVYVSRESMSTVPGGTRLTWEGKRIRLHPVSVITGYLRVWPFIAAIVIPVALIWGERVTWRPEMLWAIPFIVLGLVSAFVLGRPSARRKKELETLGNVTGLRLDPKYLEPYDRIAIQERIGDALEAAGIPTEHPQPFDLPPEAQSLGYAFARYAGVEDKAWRKRAEEISPLLSRSSEAAAPS